MTAPVLTLASTVLCPHGGRVVLAGVVRAVTAGVPLASAAGGAGVSGCPAPDPCVQIVWTGPASRVTAGGGPVLTAASHGVCVAASGQPAGAAILAGAAGRIGAI